MYNVDEIVKYFKLKYAQFIKRNMKIEGDKTYEH